jgi:uncharacterized protein
VDLDLVIELLPVTALLRSGHRIRIAVAGSDASCSTYYGSPADTFALTLDEDTGVEENRNENRR